MDTLPLLPIVGLQVEKISQSELLTDKSGSKMFRETSKYRVFSKESYKFTQYTNNIAEVRAFLLVHVGIPFIWSYTGKTYYWTGADIEYLVDGTKGNVSLTLVLDTNK